MGKFRKDYGSLAAALFFVGMSLLGFMFSSKTGVIKENGASKAYLSSVRVVNIASTAGDGASLSAPSSAFLSAATETNSFVPPAPEFLSLGEVKDPGVLAVSAVNQPGKVALRGGESVHSSGPMPLFAFKLGQ